MPKKAFKDPIDPTLGTREMQERLVLRSAWASVIKVLGYPASNPHLRDSPDRVARFFQEWHTEGKDPPDMTVFPNKPRVDELVVTSGIQFYSVCAHHGVPFFGTAAIGYIPNKAVLGLSKFARVVDHFANRFQTQEHLSQDIADYLVKALQPRGLGVVMRGEHLCMSMRGIRKPGHLTTTSVLLGACKKDPATRAEFAAHGCRGPLRAQRMAPLELLGGALLRGRQAGLPHQALLRRGRHGARSPAASTPAC